MGLKLGNNARLFIVTVFYGSAEQYNFQTGVPLTPTTLDFQPYVTFYVVAHNASQAEYKARLLLLDSGKVSSLNQLTRTSVLQVALYDARDTEIKAELQRPLPKTRRLSLPPK